MRPQPVHHRRKFLSLPSLPEVIQLSAVGALLFLQSHFASKEAFDKHLAENQEQSAVNTTEHSAIQKALADVAQTLAKMDHQAGQIADHESRWRALEAAQCQPAQHQP